MGKTTAHVSARAGQVLDLLLCGYNRAAIQKWAAEKSGWGIKTRSVDRLISTARAALEAQAQTHREQELGKAIARLDLLFSKSFQIADYRTCLAIERERIQLLKLADKPRRGPVPVPAAALALRGSWRAKQAMTREASQN